jgi:hypothetical protein
MIKVSGLEKIAKENIRDNLHKHKSIQLMAT